MGEEERSAGVLVWVNVLLVFIGFLSIVAGVAPFFPALMRQVPTEIANAIEAEELVEKVGFLMGGGRASHHLVYGLFALVAGVGLFRRRGWAWGMAIVVLAIVALTTILDVFLAMFAQDVAPVDTHSVAWWVQIVAGLGAVVAWPTLVANRKVYSQ